MTIPSHVRDAIEQILGYNWQDEKRHYSETPRRQRERHIFRTMKVVRAWLDDSASYLRRQNYTTHECDRFKKANADLLQAVKLCLEALHACSDALFPHFDDDEDGSLEANASNKALAAIGQALFLSARHRES